jgi:hypothetical protein
MVTMNGHVRTMIVIALAATLALVYAPPPRRSWAQGAAPPVNVAHLRFLTEPVTIDGQPMAIVHIYSEYPTYAWVDAAGEGISAVDDVARAAVVYLWQYARDRDPELLELARLCLEFVRYMQAPDGAFYNFVFDREGTINRTGSTSFKSLDWWAMRALWALGEGVRAFEGVDQAYADALAESYRLTESAIAGTITNYGETIARYGFTLPAWLPNGAADSSGVGLLGMAAYFRARPNPETAELITRIADGIAAMRLGNHQRYPFGMIPNAVNAPGVWHDWGAHMGHALVEAGMVLDRRDWMGVAAAEADSFLLRHLAFERFRDMAVVPDRLGQIAYGTNMIVQTYMALYRATGEERYARYGGLAASWLFGNNMAGVQMYDPGTGRVFDGINGPVPWRVNRNAGAESTIEGLLSLIAVADVPAAADYLYVTPVSGNSWRIVQAEEGRRVSGQPIYYTGAWTGSSQASAGRYVGLRPGNVMEIAFDVRAEDNYLLYVAHERQVAQPRAERLRAMRIDSPPVIDGDLVEWAGIPAIASNTREQFLRGSGFWRGPDVDSHTVQVAWDDDHMYVGITVRDPEHDQPYTLSTAWQGDAMWIYVTGAPDARTLSAKFTLAQTPDGPQVWDWINSRFVRGAALAWQPAEGGYRYEAAIPWESIRISAPQAGMVIGFEAGRGIGGNSFMNLTGRDPDIAANLPGLELVDRESEAAVAAAPAQPLFLRMQLDDGQEFLVAQSVAPDRDHWWLDRVTPQPVRLRAGEHTVRFSYAGAAADGVSRVDAFYLQPAVGRRTFQHPDGRLITLTYDTLTGAASWEETGP